MSHSQVDGSEPDPLTATIERYEDQADICTIHPVEPPEDRAVTAWISAEEGSFMAITEVR